MLTYDPIELFGLVLFVVSLVLMIAWYAKLHEREARRKP